MERLDAGEMETGAGDPQSLFKSAEECNTIVNFPHLAQREDEKFWKVLVQNHFIFPERRRKSALITDENIDTDDDLVYFVREITDPKKKRKNPNHKDGEYFVRRRDSKNMETLELRGIDWERSYILNMLSHHLSYTMSAMVCYNEHENTRERFSVLKRVDKKVYLSPDKVRVSAALKETKTETGYPFLYFTNFDFDDAFQAIVVDAPGQFICLELSASGVVFGIHVKRLKLFLGGIGFKAITQQFRKSSGFWPFKAKADQKFIEVRGPNGKGFVEFGIEEVPDEEESLPFMSGVVAAVDDDDSDSDEDEPPKTVTPPTVRKKGDKLSLRCMPSLMALRYDTMLGDIFQAIDQKLKE